MLVSFLSHNEIAKIINLQRERVCFGSELEILVQDPVDHLLWASGGCACGAG